MTERRFYQVRWGMSIFGWRHNFRWISCGHRHRFLKNARKCAKAMASLTRRTRVFEVTERRRVAWDPTYSRVEEAP